MWTRSPVDLDGDGVADAWNDLATYTQANLIVRELELAGHTDWGLPSTSEMSSLVLPGPWGDESPPMFEPGGGIAWIGSTNWGDPCHGAQLAAGLAFGSIGLAGSEGSEAYTAYVLAVRSP